MVQSDTYEVLSAAFSNPTKMSIIMLLVENERMTVTSMAKYLDVSRSNLYHFVAQLVADGILNEPEVVPKKNYVEKYYTLNREMFASMDPDELVKQVKRLTPSEIRTLLGSVLMSYSMSLKLAADEIYQSSDEESENLKEWLLTKPAWLSYSALGESTSAIVEEHLKTLLEALLEGAANERTAHEEEISRFMIVFLPFLKRSIRNTGKKQD